MKKVLVVLCIILLLLIPSINAITIIPDKNRYVEKSANKIGLKESNVDELDRIFDDLKEKMKNVNTKEECNLLFKETLIKLDKYGLLGNIELDDAINLISNNDEESYSVLGESTRTNLLERVGVLCYALYEINPLLILMKIISGLTWELFLESIKLPYHTGSWITYGYAVGNWEGRIDSYEPAEGYIKIVGPEGEEEFNGAFYGQILRFDGVGGFAGEHLRYHYVGIKGFKGWSNGNYYFGTAKEVNIESNVPKYL